MKDYSKLMLFRRTLNESPTLCKLVQSIDTTAIFYYENEDWFDKFIGEFRFMIRVCPNVVEIIADMIYPDRDVRHTMTCAFEDGYLHTHTL